MPNPAETGKRTGLSDRFKLFPSQPGFPNELTVIQPENPETQANLEAAKFLGTYLRRSQDSPIPTVFWAAPSAVGLVVSWKRWEIVKKKTRKPEYGISFGRNSITATIPEGDKTSKAEAVFQITGRNNLGILLISAHSSEELLPVLTSLAQAAAFREK